MKRSGLSWLALIVASQSVAAVSAEDAPLRDKTLVSWVRITDLDARGGSVLTIQSDAEEFDALVFGELSPRKWMAGSDLFRRTQRDQAAWPAESASPDTVVQIAASYRGSEITIFRNAEEVARYRIDRPQDFGRDSITVFGVRHLAAGDRGGFRGAILDARIYAEALDAQALGKLKPDISAGPTPWAWWSFESGKAEDLAKRFPAGWLHAGARIEKGELVLSAPGAHVVAGGEATRTRETEDWPVWHFTAWPDEGVALPYDANGCIFWKGRYHLMYIFQDPKLPHGGHAWGHASSTDLVNWTFHPPAVVPEPTDPDKGIFSGNAFVNREGRPMLCWFGIDAGVCVATAEDDDLIVWKKHPKNPIVPMPKPGQPGHSVYTVWDPFLWLEGDDYVCLLGGNKLPNGKDTLYTCKSKDLVTWEALHPFFEHPDLSWTTDGEDCSCPDFFSLNGRHVLLCISHKVGARIYVGRFDKASTKFFPERHVRMNWPGGTFFAPESLVDLQGRRIFWAWVTDPRSMTTQRATGSGFQSMPRVLALAEDGAARITPAVELEALRRARQTIGETALLAGGEVTLDGVRGDVMEFSLEIDPQEAKEVGVKVRCSPDGGEETSIVFHRAAKRLSIDMSRSTTRRDVKYSAGPLDGYGSHRDPRKSVDAPFELAPGETLKLRIFLDKPLLEVFANDRQCVTQQIFPASRQALGVRAFATGGTGKILRGEAWELAPAKFIDARGRR